MSTETLEVLKAQEARFIMQKCGACGATMTLEAGDVLFGMEWFHKSCWNSGEGDRALRDAELESQLNDTDQSPGL